MVMIEHERVVHILAAGYPLCMFTTLLPGYWPRGHVWVSIAETGFDSHELCAECRDERTRRR
jgi:hypothetical protein